MIQKFLNLFLELGIFQIYSLVIILSILNGVILFPSSQLILIIAGIISSQKNMNVHLILITIIISNVLGNYFLYLLIKKYGEKFVRKFIPIRKKKLDDYIIAIKYLFRKYGPQIILIGRNLPIFHSLVSIPAGLSNIRKKTFLIYTTIGITIWSIVFFYIGVLFSENYLEIIEMMKSIFSLISLVLILYLYYLFRKYLKKIVKIAKEEK